MCFSPTILERLYCQLGAKNRCPIKEANQISLIYLKRMGLGKLGKCYVNSYFNVIRCFVIPSLIHLPYCVSIDILYPQKARQTIFYPLRAFLGELDKSEFAWLRRKPLADWWCRGQEASRVRTLDRHDVLHRSRRSLLRWGNCFFFHLTYQVPWKTS